METYRADVKWDYLCKVWREQGGPARQDLGHFVKVADEEDNRPLPCDNAAAEN